MSQNTKSEFAKMCRALRVHKGLKQREVAVSLGVAPSTVGNMESSAFKIVGRDKVDRMIKLYDLAAAAAAGLVSAWDRCPLSPDGEKRREFFRKRNELRSKSKNHDPLKLALVELLGLHLMAVPDAEVCACDFGTVCGVCKALESVGLDPFTPSDRDKILTRLVKIQADLTPATPSA